MTVTLPEMTRFLLTLDRAVDTVFQVLRHGKRGETYVPKVPAAMIVDVAKALMGSKDLPIVFTGIRPGEKVHEIMVSEEECFRTVDVGEFYAIRPVLPELRFDGEHVPALTSEYSSKDVTLNVEDLKKLLASADQEIDRFLAAIG